MRTTKDFNVEIRELAEAWCDRREYGALASLLPYWVSNNGLTDGWALLADALHHTAGINLPDQERATLKRLWVEVDTMLRSR